VLAAAAVHAAVIFDNSVQPFPGLHRMFRDTRQPARLWLLLQVLMMPVHRRLVPGLDYIRPWLDTPCFKYCELPELFCLVQWDTVNISNPNTHLLVIAVNNTINGGYWI
jgi:hypothetical protein